MLSRTWPPEPIQESRTPASMSSVPNATKNAPTARLTRSTWRAWLTNRTRPTFSRWRRSSAALSPPASRSSERTSRGSRATRNDVPSAMNSRARITSDAADDAVDQRQEGGVGDRRHDSAAPLPAERQRKQGREQHERGQLRAADVVGQRECGAAPDAIDDDSRREQDREPAQRRADVRGKRPVQAGRAEHLAEEDERQQGTTRLNTSVEAE